MNQESPLQIEAEVLKAETVWLKQGRAGAFKTSFAIRFIVKDREKQEEVVYRQIHEGSASHSQTYGGYPASASVVDALSAVYRDYERAIKDMSPDILASLEPLRFEGVFVIFGFKNRQGQRIMAKGEVGKRPNLLEAALKAGQALARSLLSDHTTR